MSYLKNFHVKSLKYNLVNKFFYNSTAEIPKIKKIIIDLNFVKNNESKNIASSLLALRLLSGDKGALNLAKTPNLKLKIKKGDPTSTKITLRNLKMFNFFEKNIIEALPKLQEFQGLIYEKAFQKNSVHYKINDGLSFSDLKIYYAFFKNLSSINITLVSNSGDKKEMLFITKSSQILVK
jgi:large subunit ribosomal protein L5